MSTIVIAVSGGVVVRLTGGSSRNCGSCGRSGILNPQPLCPVPLHQVILQMDVVVDGSMSLDYPLITVLQRVVGLSHGGGGYL